MRFYNRKKTRYRPIIIILKKKSFFRALELRGVVAFITKKVYIIGVRKYFLQCMIITRPLKDVFQTAAEMRRLTCQYWADLGRWLDADFMEYFNYVCALPYVSDPEQVETISRPAFTLREDYGPRDCDDKAVLIACWLYAHGVPVRFVAISTAANCELCHVFAHAWGMDIDATYNEYHGMLGKYPYNKDVTARADLTTDF